MWENIHRKITRMVKSLELMSHEDWLEELGMFNLGKRKWKINMIIDFKYPKSCHVEEGLDH